MGDQTVQLFANIGFSCQHRGFLSQTVRIQPAFNQFIKPGLEPGFDGLRQGSGRTFGLLTQPVDLIDMPMKNRGQRRALGFTGGLISLVKKLPSSGSTRRPPAG